MGEVISCLNHLSVTEQLWLSKDDHAICLDYVVSAALGINNAGYLQAESLLLQNGYTPAAVDSTVAYINQLLGESLYNAIINAKTHVSDQITFDIRDDLVMITITKQPTDALHYVTDVIRTSLEAGDFIPERIRHYYGVS